jgi:hypothetical protein
MAVLSTAVKPHFCSGQRWSYQVLGYHSDRWASQAWIWSIDGEKPKRSDYLSIANNMWPIVGMEPVCTILYEFNSLYSLHCLLLLWHMHWIIVACNYCINIPSSQTFRIVAWFELIQTYINMKWKYLFERMKLAFISNLVPQCSFRVSVSWIHMLCLR